MTMMLAAARHPMFATLALRNGRRVDLVSDRHRYVTSEENRAVIGPVQHRRRFGWRKRGQMAAERVVTRDNIMTMADMGENLAKAVAQIGANLRAIPAPLPPQDDRSRWQKMKDKWLDRFYSKDWHDGIRHTAVDALTWAFVITVVLCFGKGLSLFMGV